MGTLKFPTPAMQELSGLVWQCGHDNFSSSHIRILIRQNGDVIEQALREVMQPDLVGVSISDRFSIIDSAKSLVTRKISAERLSNRMGVHANLTIMHSGNELLLKYLMSHRGSMICTFVMSSEGEVWTYIIKEAFTPEQPDRVDYALCQVVTKEDAPEFMAAFRQYLESLTSGRVDFDTQTYLLHKIGSTIVPLIAQLGLANRIVLIPHRLLHSIPLHAMFIQNESKVIYINDLVASITYASSLHESYMLGHHGGIIKMEFDKEGKIIERPFELASNANRLLAVLDTECSELAWVRFESQYYEMLKKQGIPLDIVQSRSQIPDDLKPYLLIHWSGHGKSDPVNWGGSSLTFSGKTYQTLNIAKDWSLSARLVTLGACETALHMFDQDFSDEYCGLDLAFRLAGATNVYATMWPIHDHTAAIASQMLNASFMLGGGTPSQALGGMQYGFRKGTWKRILRKEPSPTLDRSLQDEYHEQIKRLHSLDDDVFADPRHWAVFRCFGP